MPIIENPIRLAELNTNRRGKCFYEDEQIRDDGERVRFVPKIARKTYKDFLPKSIADDQHNFPIRSFSNNYAREKEKPVDVLTPWIMGGNIGSKDTLLVFRTSALSQATTFTNSVSELESCSSTSSSDGFIHELINDERGKSVDSLSLLNPNKLPAVINKSSVRLIKKSLTNDRNKTVSKSKLSTSTSEPVLPFRDENTDPKKRIADLESFSKSSGRLFQGSSKAIVPNNRSDMPGALLNIRYRLLNTESRLLRRILCSHGLKESDEDQSFNIMWTGVHLKPDILRNLLPYQRVNHFPRSYELTRKDRLYKNIEKMQHLRGFKHFDIVPETFLLPLEYKDFVVAHNKYRGPWIVKPVASSCGRGIFIIHSPEQVPSDEQLLVAKYIANPLCIDGHKCDLRLYVTVTSFDPLLIYIYEEGLVRLATVKYNPGPEYLWNSCMHLCNYSINKYHSDYIKSMNADVEDVGHKWTLSALLRHLKSQGCDTDQLMLNIEDLIIKAIFSCTQSIASACRMFVPNVNNCFELYGFDILIDDTLKPWLLEINLSPSLSADSPLDVKVKASLLTDLLNLVGVPAISPLMKAAYDSKYVKSKGFSYSTAGTHKRRVNSADFVQNPSKKTTVITTLSNEEQKIVKAAKSQYERRGGFVRIFPTENCLSRYGAYLDPVTGIPTQTPSPSGSQSCSMIIPRNHNLMLHSQIYSPGEISLDSFIADRMAQYERALEIDHPISSMGSKFHGQKCADEARRLRKQIRRLIENGNELSQLQARKAFQMYLEFILKRLSVEPKQYHEKMILKFIQRSGIAFKMPAFIKYPLKHKIMPKDRSALILKLLSDYIENYYRDTESVSENVNNGRYAFIPSKLFLDFISQASEHDLEQILTIHTNATQHMPFLYDRCAINAPAPRPIPVGVDGFLKALPNMAPKGPTKDSVKIDLYYKSLENRGALPNSFDNSRRK